MNEKNNICNKKLNIGAKLSLAACIIAIISTAIIFILSLSLKSILPDNLPVSTFFTIIGIIVVITIVGSAFLIKWCNKVLKGDSKDAGTALGITMIVLSALTLFTIFGITNGGMFLNLVTGGLGLAGGILLIIGKYENNNQQELNTIEPK